MFEPDGIGEDKFTYKNKTLNHSAFNLAWLSEINPQTVFDIGAYDFGDSIRIKERYPETKVYAFEADKNNYNIFSPFAIECNINCYNMAISDVTGEIDFYTSKHIDNVNAQGSIYKPTQVYKDYYSYVSHTKSMCHSVRIDDFWHTSDKIDLLHIDVEGAENAVLRGLGDIRPTLIYLEFLLGDGWEGQSFQEIEGWFKDNKYELVKVLPHDRLYYKI